MSATKRPRASVDCRRPKAPPRPCNRRRRDKSPLRPGVGEGSSASDVPEWELRPNRGRWRSRAHTASVQTPTAALQRKSRGKCRSTNSPSASMRRPACGPNALLTKYGSDAQRLIVRVQIPVAVEGSLTLAVPKWNFQSGRTKNLWKTNEAPVKSRARNQLCCARLLIKFSFVTSGVL